MTNKVVLSMHEVEAAADRVAKDIHAAYGYKDYRIFGIPRGGLVPAYAIAAAMKQYAGRRPSFVVHTPEQANVFVDDLVDSGDTRSRYVKRFPKVPFHALFHKNDLRLHLPDVYPADSWLVFPWEVTKGGEDESAHDIVTRLLQHIGEDASREGLLETPRRVVAAWDHWFGGYKQDPASVLKVFEDGAENIRGDQMVLVGNIPVFSTCEHHMAPIFGSAWIGYIPNGKIVGLSKFKRLVEVFARRLQVQERLTTQLADAIEDTLRPKGVGVLLRCRHMCMESRGINTQGSMTTTSALRGVFIANPSAKQEFMEMCRG